MQLSFGESIAQSISESSHQHDHPQKPIHGYDGSRMIPFGRPARRFGIIYVSAQLVNMEDNSSLYLQNVCCSGISRTEDECGKARGWSPPGTRTGGFFGNPNFSSLMSDNFI
ncbi:hypothetical protein OIU78_022554 [Salix suchowensis]|nr:hypothetical protein OIU78_022554 [Salix suchowensis]